MNSSVNVPVPASNQGKPSGGFVFYPRQYIVGQDMHSSYALGVNQFGVPCAVYIKPTPAAIEAARTSTTAQTVPNIAEFADTSRRAKNPCFCSVDNGPESPEGMLVIEQAIIDDSLSNLHSGYVVYVGRWASVLRDSSDMPIAPFGPGYFEVTFSPKVDPHVNELLTRYQEVEGGIADGNVDNLADAEESRSELYREIMSTQKKFFVGVLIKHNEIFEIQNPTQQSLYSEIFPVLEKYTDRGMYGGVLIRIREKNIVFSEFCFSCNMQYDYKNRCVIPTKDVLGGFLKYNASKIIRAAKGRVLEVIPVQRVNCGSMGTDKYSKQFNTRSVPKILKTFVDKRFHNVPMANYLKEKAFLFANIGIRLSLIREGRSGANNVLISTLHAFSAPLGNIYTIAADGTSKYQMDK